MAMEQNERFGSSSRARQTGRQIFQVVAAAMLALALVLAPAKVQASFMDTDTYCVTYGCVAVGDGADFAVYDAYIFATNTCCVAANQPLIRWASSTLIGAGGTVTMVVTGTLAAATVPTATQYTRMGLDTNADGTADIVFADTNANSFLDAADTQAAFAINGGQRIALNSRAVSRSLFMTSTMDFDVYGSAAKATSTGTFGPAVPLTNVGVAFSITQTGTDGGQAFGASAANPIFVANVAITNLGQLSPGPTRVAEFRRTAGIRGANLAGTNVMPQCVRFNSTYTLPAVDLSMGTGSADIDLTLNFYQRP
jgi:hypothetical protein